MQQNKNNNFFNKYKKLFAGVLFFVIVTSSVLTPVSVLAVDATTANTTNTTGSVTTTTGGSSDLGTSLDALIQSSATCSIGAILFRLIASTIGKLIQDLTRYLTGFITSYFTDLLKMKVKKAVKILPEVPVFDESAILELGKIKMESRQITNKETGAEGHDGDSILSGFFSSISTVSLDSIMFCIINEIMSYITQATITWINSGFDGNPVFLENPGGFFQGIVDKESSNFIKELSGAQGMVANGVSGIIIGIADPLRDSVVNSIIGTSNGNFANMVAPTMSTNITNNYNSIMSGQIIWPGFDGMMQLSQSSNNAYGLTSMARHENLRRITIEQQSQAQQLLYNGGYKSFTTCPSGKTRADGSCYPYYSVVSTAGSQTKDELQSRGMMKYMRISFANDFDSIITALVNQLIKIAVTDINESFKK